VDADAKSHFERRLRRNMDLLARFGEAIGRMGASPVMDVSSLPAPMEDMERAFDESESYLRGLIEGSVSSGHSKVNPQLERRIDSLCACRLFLSGFVDLDAKDRASVAELNSLAADANLSPEQALRFGELFSKYRPTGQ